MCRVSEWPARIAPLPGVPGSVHDKHALTANFWVHGAGSRSSTPINGMAVPAATSIFMTCATCQPVSLGILRGPDTVECASSVFAVDRGGSAMQGSNARRQSKPSDP